MAVAFERSRTVCVSLTLSTGREAAAYVVETAALLYVRYSRRARLLTSVGAGGGDNGSVVVG